MYWRSVVMGWSELIGIRKFAGKFARIVEQDREVLGADPELLFFELQEYQRHLIFITVAVNTVVKGIVHVTSNVSVVVELKGNSGAITR